MFCRAYGYLVEHGMRQMSGQVSFSFLCQLERETEMAHPAQDGGSEVLCSVIKISPHGKLK